MIELSVGLPIWNSKKIIWLALESLCRQKEINFDWELVIAEEQIDEIGQEIIDGYFKRLVEVGCCKVFYEPLKEWIPLSKKWKLLGEKCDENSKVFILQASDCYSQPYRLRSTYEAIIRSDCDWYKANHGLFYNIQTKQHILYSDPINIQRGGLNMATKTEYIRKLPVEDRASKVDGWLYSKCNPQKVYIDSNSYWQLGVDTHGLNNISKKRGKFFNKIEFPFVETSLNIKNLLPQDIIKRLEELC
jgi:hypothetical protein